MKTIELVTEFHKAFSHPVGEKPELISKERANLRISLIQEELNELKEAIEDDDLVEVADALVDIQYVLDGAFVEFGFRGYKELLVKEVHASNMSKLCSSAAEAQVQMDVNPEVSSYECVGDDSYAIYREDG